MLFPDLRFQFIVRCLQTIAPVAYEELFPRGQKGVRCAENGAQRGGHLHRDEQEYDDPSVETRVRPGVRVGKSGLQKPQSEDGRDEPENQMQRAHPGQRIGGLRENPRHRREADEQNRHQHQQPGEQPADLDEPRLRAAQAGEDVKARQADER